MSYTVALLNFEGPLDLLLQLIERADLEITQISLSDVTSQYLDYIGSLPSLSPVELGQFLNLAARLTYLKSLALLPSQTDATYEAELTDLTEALAQYQHYQKATRYLETLLKTSTRSWERQSAPILPIEKIPLPQITLDALGETLKNALAQIPKLPVERQRLPAVTAEDMLKRFNSWWHEQPSSAALARYFATLTTRDELIMSFIVLLEQAKSALIILSQAKPYGEVLIERPAA